MAVCKNNVWSLDRAWHLETKFVWNGRWYPGDSVGCRAVLEPGVPMLAGTGYCTGVVCVHWPCWAEIGTQHRHHTADYKQALQSSRGTFQGSLRGFSYSKCLSGSCSCSNDSWSSFSLVNNLQVLERLHSCGVFGFGNNRTPGILLSLKCIELLKCPNINCPWFHCPWISISIDRWQSRPLTTAGWRVETFADVGHAGSRSGFNDTESTHRWCWCLSLSS